LEDFPELRLKLRKEEAAPRFNTEYRSSRSFAIECHFGENAVRCAGQVTNAVEKLKKIDPEITSKVSTGKVPPKDAVVNTAAMIEKLLEKSKAMIEGYKKMADIIRKEKRKEIILRLENVFNKQAKELAV